MSLLDSEEILGNDADLAVLNDHANYRGITQGLPSFDECKIGDIFWVRDESNFYIRDFKNWRVIPPFDIISDNVLGFPLADYSLVDQGPKNYQIKLNKPQTITGIDKLYHGGHDVDICTVKINYSNEII